MLMLNVASFHYVRAASDAPYLYYYSREQSAFIVERADGNDRKILAHYEPKGSDVAIGGPGWSPSGKWFAWGEGIPGFGSGEEIFDVFVASRDGNDTREVSTGGIVKDLGGHRTTITY
jgi:hypothetical protein